MAAQSCTETQLFLAQLCQSVLVAWEPFWELTFQQCTLAYLGHQVRRALRLYHLLYHHIMYLSSPQFDIDMYASTGMSRLSKACTAVKGIAVAVRHRGPKIQREKTGSEKFS